METTTAKPRTPGFNCHLQIRFSADRNGRGLAHYWSARGFRWIRVGRNDAEMWVAQGLATKVAS